VTIDVYFTPAETAGQELARRTAVVIDVLRATSTMTEALANGARGIYPVGTTEEAIRLAQNLEGALLCGERRSLRVEGFDLGNSPAEFTPEAVQGRTLVMATTNGTPALVAAAGAGIAVAASFLNRTAVVEAVIAEGRPVAIVCAGRERRFALEDTVCAGSLVSGIMERVDSVTLNDAGLAAVELATRFGADLEGLFRRTAAGVQLLEADLESDLPLCAEVDRRAAVPRLRERQLTLSP
jgi:2-phosphosulfolactate phosphatase